MSMYSNSGKPARRASGGLVLYNGGLRLTKKAASVVAVIVVASNLLTYAFFTPGLKLSRPASVGEAAPLYLMDKASVYVLEAEDFEQKVRRIAKRLSVPPEWLMAIMYAESRFDASVSNRRGSKATGLIQFMPATAADFNTSVTKLAAMPPIQQLDYVYRYFARVKGSHGTFNNLTDLYLAVLYPRALGKDYCYTLYSKPTVAYARNSGLDENRDGHVTVSDIDRRLRRIFPTAFAARIGEEGEE